jgi:hypothetical protein
MVETLTLKEKDCIASGTQRQVYMHPHDPTKLVKVLRDAPLTKGRAKLATRTERYFPSLRRRWARKEYQEYLRLMLGDWGKDLHPPIAHMYGFAVTNLGLGCLSDAVVAQDGTLGETLQDKVKTETLNATDLALFNDTIRRMYDYDVRAGDMTARNFVFGQRAYSGKPGPRECVLVDGFGDIHAIPMRSWGRFFNKYGLDDSCKRLAQRTDLRWNPTKRQFSL